MSDSNKGRVLTLVVTIQDPEAAKAIWDTHVNGGTVSGFRIDSIANEDQLQQLDNCMEYLTEDQLEEFTAQMYKKAGR